MKRMACNKSRWKAANKSKDWWIRRRCIRITCHFETSLTDLRIHLYIWTHAYHLSLVMLSSWNACTHNFLVFFNKIYKVTRIPETLLSKLSIKAKVPFQLHPTQVMRPKHRSMRRETRRSFVVYGAGKCLQ
jgi:hypothetical protein